MLKKQGLKGVNRIHEKTSDTSALESVIDRLVYQLYGFTEEELDFIINYDIKYRMGDELNENE